MYEIAPNDKVLDTALKKIRWMRKREWCACLSPSEILKLSERGIKFESYKISWAKALIESGQSQTTWCYFNLSPEVERLLGKRMKLKFE